MSYKNVIKDSLIEDPEFLCLSETLVKEAANRLLFALQHLCLQENINIKFYNSIFELNEISENQWVLGDNGKKRYITPKLKTVNEDELAVGRYTWLRETSWEEQKKLGYPIISFINKSSFDIYNVFTFAHEVGHHFCVKYNNDFTEKGADHYIETLCKKLLSEKDLKALRLYIEVRRQNA